MASPSQPPISLSASELEHTFGVFFVGYVAAMVGYGFTFFQTYVYYSRYPRDHWALKLCVIAVSFTDTASSALMSHALYHYIVGLFPYTTGLVDATGSLCGEIGLSAFGVWVVQIFYAYRVWTLSHSFPITGFIATASTAAFALGLAMSAELANNPALAHLANSGPEAVVATCQALKFLAGVLTFGIMCHYLRPSITPSYKPPLSRFDRLVAYTINRISVASVIQFGYFLTFISKPSKLYWIPFHFVATKLFVNSLLTMLNSREVVRGQGLNEEQSVDQRKTTGSLFTSSGPRSTPGVRFNVVDSKQTQPINIEVSRTIEQHESNDKSYNYMDTNSPYQTPSIKAQLAE